MTRPASTTIEAGAYRLTVSGFTAEELAALNKNNPLWRTKPSYRLPAPIGDPPKPPDYSTPAQVTRRCLEAGTRTHADILAAMHDPSFKRDYRAVVKLGHRAPLIADTHVSRWRVVENSDRSQPYRFTLKETGS